MGRTKKLCLRGKLCLTQGSDREDGPQHATEGMIGGERQAACFSAPIVD